MNIAVLLTIKAEMQARLGEGPWKQSPKWRFFRTWFVEGVLSRGESGEQVGERENREARTYVV